jgi:hypothetical protein
MTARHSVFVATCALLSLAACGNIKQDLGLGRNAPDEFAVVDRPPLSIPPDFGLRPPTPGAPRPQEVDMTQRASEYLFASANDPDAKMVEPSESEKALMVQTGADKAPSDIRQIINREAAQKTVTSKYLLQELLWWKRDAQTPATTVDAKAEAKRLKEAKDKGEAPNLGATPIIEKNKSGWLGL